jgi:cytidylate kinase
VVVRNPIMMSKGKAPKTEEQHRLGRGIQSGSDWTSSHSEGLLNGKATFRIIAIERECACGAAVISRKLSDILGWKLWDQLLADEIADLIHSDMSAKHRLQPVDERFCRLAKVFWRGSYERSAQFDDWQFVDPVQMVAIMQKVCDKIAREGNAIVLGRGAPGFLQDRDDTFHVFFYAPREERIRRLIANGKSESETGLVEAVDRERSAFVKHYFGADWPTRSFYDLMINTAIGEDNTVSTILHTMFLMQEGKR